VISVQRYKEERDKVQPCLAGRQAHFFLLKLLAGFQLFLVSRDFLVLFDASAVLSTSLAKRTRNKLV